MRRPRRSDAASCVRPANRRISRRPAPLTPRLLLVALTLIAATLLPRAARAQGDLPNELNTVADVRFKGRSHVSKKELLSVMKTRATDRLLGGERPPVRLDFLRSDLGTIEDVYHQHGYLDATATYELSPAKEAGSTIVTFRIAEGPRATIRHVDLVGVHAIDPDPLRRTLFVKKGKAFNPYFLLADTAKIIETYKDHGYFPEVHARWARKGSAVAVEYDIAEGPRYRYGPTTIQDPQKLSVNEHFVRRELLMKPGNIYRSTRVQESVERLYQTGVFSQVLLNTAIDSTNATISFDLALHERRPRWVDAGIGSGTTERLLATAEWGHRNLFGRGRQGVLDGRLSLDGKAQLILGRVDASIVEPWLFGTRTRGAFTVYHAENHDNTDPAVFTKNRTEGVSVSLTRQSGRFTKFSLTQDNTFVHQQLTYKDPAADTVYTPPYFTTHRLQLVIDRDTRNHPVLMTRGSYQELTTEIAGGVLQGASRFFKNHITSSWYTPLRPGLVLATRTRAGIIRPFGPVVQFSNEPGVDPEVARVPVFDRFRIGGVNSIRGYGENSIPPNGGLVLLQGNIELRADVWGPLGIEAYVDAGNVWSTVHDVGQGAFGPMFGGRNMGPNDVRWSLGLGPQLQLPFGPLRVDFTWWSRPDERGHIQRGLFQFAIGPSF